jgi:hypothetical protein
METHAIVEIFGGRKIFERTIEKSDDLAGFYIRKGLPAGSVTSLAETIHIGNAASSREVGIPQRTLTRGLSEGSF